MALQITKESKFGIEATYWKIVGTLEDWSLNSRIVITLYGWTDQEMRSEHPQDPIITKSLEIDMNAFETDPIRGTIYDMIKSLPGWETAIDC